jgi:chemotaxis response regulator CheB
MNSIRIHLGPLPPMLRTMINDLLEEEPDMTVVGNSYAGEDSLVAASADKADMVISQEQTSLSDTCLSAIITQNPAAILAISPNGNGGTSVNFVHKTVSLDGAGTSALANTVREILGRE